MPRTGDPDPRLPRAFRTPEATFHHWMQATQTGDPEAVAACFWSGLSPDELQSWVSANLRPETRRGFRGARWGGFRPVSAVEGIFLFSTTRGDTFRGVMVRTAKGWKIQRF